MTTVRRFNKLRELENRVGGSDTSRAEAERLYQEFEEAHRIGDNYAVAQLYGLIVNLRVQPVLSHNRSRTNEAKDQVETPQQVYERFIGRTLDGEYGAPDTKTVRSIRRETLPNDQD